MNIEQPINSVESKFKNFLDELDELDLPIDQYAITSSGTLAVRGIREAKDIDLIVTDYLWQELALKYPPNIKSDCETINIGNIEILGKFKGELTYMADEQIAQSEIIDGHRYVNLKMVTEFKKMSSREKDKNDLELIKSYLTNGGK